MVAYAAPVIPDDPQVAEMKKLFMWFWISLIGIIIGVGAIAAGVFFFIIVYKTWKLIQHEGVRGDPDKMVSSCFIPGWNFYWVFPAIRGLAKELNEAMDKENVTAERINLDMVTWMIICLFGATITFGVSLIPFIVFWIMYTNKVKNAYNALYLARK
jgi:H+/Cl- antiporter ClcA